MKAAVSAAAFVLGISLMLGGLVPLAAHLGDCAESGASPAEALQPDYQETAAFRDAMSIYFETLAALDSGDWENSLLADKFAEIEQIQEQGITTGDFLQNLFHYLWRDDNILYDAYRNGYRRYYNNSDALNRLGADLPAGYSFFLYFDGQKARVCKDGAELDIYGDGVYRGEGWYLPGYDNLSADGLENIEIVMAVREKPEKIYAWAEYGGESGGEQTSLLFALYDAHRTRFFSLWLGVGLFAVGTALFALSLCMRESRRAAKEAVRRLIGRFWWEGKLLFLAGGVLLTVWLFVQAAANSSAVGTVYALYSPVSLWDWPKPVRLYLFLPAILTAFWLAVFAVFDLCGRPWQNSLVRKAAGHLFRGPFGRRMQRISAACFAGTLLLAAGSCGMVALAGLWEGNSADMALCLVIGVLIALVLLGVVCAYIWRCLKVFGETDALAGRIAEIRAGNFTGTPALPPEAELAAVSRDLQQIEQGMDAAIEERIKSERMKIELIANVSHDLKTPLTSIISYADLLCGEELPAPSMDYARILRSKALRLKEMVQDVFEVSKATSGQLPVKLETLDLGKLIRQTLADMIEAIEESPVLIRENLPDEPVLIMADGQRLYRVFQNLIQNALQYSLPGSRVYIRLEAVDGRAAASIRNTSRDELDPAADFTERFVRGDKSRTDGGSGLGLSIARSFTEACGGTLSVTVEADQFTAAVQFPLASSPAAE